MRKNTQKSVDTARAYLNAGNEGAYARLMSSLQRAASTDKEANAVVACIVDDGTQHLFTFSNNCLNAS